MSKVLKIGTRGSKLAMVQTAMVAELLRQSHPGILLEIVEIKTSGDWKPEHGETRLSEAQGGKGLFAKEIEEALLAGQVDCGVHSLKDMPSFLPEGLAIDHVLPREDARDALLSNNGKTIAELPQGAVVGTSSTRRAAMMLAKRPDLKCVPLRGNVPTRIEKLRAGQVDAAILALAGLKRLDLTGEIASIIAIEDMLPAACQGIVGIETRADDQETRTLLTKLHCKVTGYCAAAERAALQALGGSCRTPIGAHAVVENDTVKLELSVAAMDGSALYEDKAEAPVATTLDAAKLGHALGMKLKAVLPAGILE